MTCHRGSVSIRTMQDTLADVANQRGIDSAITAYRRMRERYAGRMAFDLTDYPLRDLAARLSAQGRDRDAVVLLEEAALDFPASIPVALALASAYEKTGDVRRAIAQYGRALSLAPDNRRALERVRALNPP